MDLLLCLHSQLALGEEEWFTHTGTFTFLSEWVRQALYHGTNVAAGSLSQAQLACFAGAK
jgi:hypothetical protein